MNITPQRSAWDKCSGDRRLGGPRSRRWPRRVRARAPGRPRPRPRRGRVTQRVTSAENWIMGSGELSAAQAAGASSVRYAVSSAHLFVLLLRGQTSTAGQQVADFRSYAELKKMIRQGAIWSCIHWVMYDNEQWSLTPADEQADPVRYEQLFARLAHRQGTRSSWPRRRISCRASTRTAPERQGGGRPTCPWAWPPHRPVRPISTRSRLSRTKERLPVAACLREFRRGRGRPGPRGQPERRDLRGPTRNG